MESIVLFFIVLFQKYQYSYHFMFRIFSHKIIMILIIRYTFSQFINKIKLLLIKLLLNIQSQYYIKKFFYNFDLRNLQQNVQSMKRKFKDIVSEQKYLLHEALSLPDSTSLWKVLIFDGPARHVISSIYKMKDLRENNVTLYLNIKEKRQQLHRVTAIYMVQPTTQNIEIIASDFEKDKYSSVKIHFISEPSAHILSMLAKSLSKQKINSIGKIKKIQYSSIGFNSLDKRMVITPSITQFTNLLITLRHNPIFVYNPKDQDFVNSIKQKMTNLKEKLDQYSHTLVLIFNRDIDFYPVYSHGITYGALISDICTLHPHGSKVTSLSGTTSQLDLNDQIWLERKNLHIGDMQLQRELNKIKAKLPNANNKMDQYAELTQSKKKVEWHISLASQLIQEGKKRRLNQFHEVQSQLYTKKLLTKDMKNQFIDLLEDSTEKDDKFRLLILYMLFSDHVDQCEQFEKIYPDIKQNSYYNELKVKRLKNNQPTSNSSKYIKKLAKGLWKNLVATDSKYMITKYLDKVRQLNFNEINQLGLKVSSLLGDERQNARIENVLVYCDGGVTMNQYANLSEYDPQIYYVGDRIVNYKTYSHG